MLWLLSFVINDTFDESCHGPCIIPEKFIMISIDDYNDKILLMMKKTIPLYV